MRTWTVFVIIGVLIIAALTAMSFKKGTEAQHPARVTAEQFVAAVNAGDAAAVERLVDPKAVKIGTAAGRLTTLDFAAVATGQAFMGRPANSWTMSDLQKLVVNDEIALEVDETPGSPVPATVRLSGNYLVWIRKVDDTWRVFYLEKPGTRERG